MKMKKECMIEQKTGSMELLDFVLLKWPKV